MRDKEYLNLKLVRPFSSHPPYAVIHCTFWTPLRLGFPFSRLYFLQRLVSGLLPLSVTMGALATLKKTASRALWLALAQFLAGTYLITFPRAIAAGAMFQRFIFAAPVAWLLPMYLITHQQPGSVSHHSGFTYRCLGLAGSHS